MMRMLQNSTNLGTKTHARTPVAILLPNDLKRLVHYVRTVIERQHSHPVSATEDRSVLPEELDSRSS